MWGSVMVGGVGLLMLTVMTAQLYASRQHPSLDTTPSRINPNTATAASLTRLPGIGKARALDMIDYRRHHQDGPAFRTAGDMENIKGIGPKTAEKISPWLTFETEPRMDANQRERKIKNQKVK